MKAVNANKRVWGEGGDTGQRFCFTGSTRELKAFLGQMANEKSVPLEAVLVPEAGSDAPDPFTNKPRIGYEWALRVYSPHNTFHGV